MKNTIIDKFNWSNISGDKYYEITDILNSSRADLEKEVSLIAVITDLSEDEVYDLPLGDYSAYASKLIFLNKFTYPQWKKKDIKLPSFDCKVMDDISSLNVTQYVDFQSFVSAPLRDSYDKLLSIIIIPKGCKYNDGYDITLLQKELREYLGWSEVQSLLDFFIRVSVTSLERSLKYYNRKLRKEKNPEKRKEMEWMLTETIERLQRFPKEIYIRGCVSSNG